MKSTNNNTLSSIKYSVLDLVPLVEGISTKEAIDRSVDLAQHAERYGYQRFWISEHHNMESLASSSPVILINQVAQNTKSIRVGSGGVMLPNHAPLVVAEQFGTLASIHPNRIDLGLGRAPGTDQRTAMALRRYQQETVQDFPNNIDELQMYLSEENSTAPVRATPGEGLDIPLYLLGSSTFSAQLAGKKGLPYAFASHFAPTHLHDALRLYHQHFKPSAQLEKPYSMACLNIIAADTDEEAEYLATSAKKFMLGVIRNTRKPLPSPVKSMEGEWSTMERMQIEKMMFYSFIGSKETIAQGLQTFVEETRVNEIIVIANIYDQAARLKSYQLVSEVFDALEVTV
ncbi:MAG TPA: LLM class flavin-dependent oxidoreductase [Leeuwenhoekiella sp.]|uniref:LLM class flavin-dependent oxidoreductase n=1 Tax=Leeuwenhoekiella palythoae TaxID=573501 RepID=UPI000E9DC0C0|nr:LLM class flavin-dependent oxidoreductase [Leeuwenhoekiella palythoae]UBZ09833.1 LLM class flavin-dependent oxidoreductase [Leeuwenhoekiella palythoae]HAX16841.1 LLM class flavin-dependent oxidoreductase [Leeuwenhoekiella sp.]HBO30961.1 LLM class flavin-dependent oxidoreductase [Leeuwenhoekiella sp.]HCQ76527.1 LLM class flavin-dependent oxidoreductase [Leeuwenhoekiella sp.]|tara:strand:+ start:206 stop:1237 length:1032 start_codon:yes stop_codon:yes gene_type:complete